MRWPTLSLLAGLLLATPVMAAETSNYTYDAHGRLVTAVQTGTVNGGQTTSITYDNADNRTGYVVTDMALSIADASADEGASLVFTVTRSGSTASAASVSWATGNGTAAAGTNYTASSGTVGFAVGASTATISVPTIQDNVATSDLTMTVTLSAPSLGALIGRSSATGTIRNIDTSATLSIANASANEGSPLIFTITRSGNTGAAVSAHWATSDGTAIGGTNYTSSSGTVNFATGVTAMTVSVPTIDDYALTGPLVMTTSLSAPSGGAVLGTASGTGTINNIDTAWTATLTAGTKTSCIQLFVCITSNGYIQDSIGSLSNTNYAGFTISTICSGLGIIGITMNGSVAPTNSGWNSITIPGVGTLTRASATFSSSGASSTWSWPNNPATVTSGTVTIQ